MKNPKCEIIKNKEENKAVASTMIIFHNFYENDGKCTILANLKENGPNIFSQKPVTKFRNFECTEEKKVSSNRPHKFFDNVSKWNVIDGMKGKYVYTENLKKHTKDEVCFSIFQEEKN